jgi:hypothetical protein
MVIEYGTLVERELARETEVFRENLPQCYFIHHKINDQNKDRTRVASVGNLRLPAWDMVWLSDRIMLV